MIKIHLRSHFNTYIKPSLLYSVMMMARKSGSVSLQLCRGKAEMFKKGTVRAKGQASARVTPVVIRVILPPSNLLQQVPNTARLGRREITIS